MSIQHTNPSSTNGGSSGSDSALVVTEQHAKEGGASSSTASQRREPQQDKAPHPVSPRASKKSSSMKSSSSRSSSSSSKAEKVVRFNQSVTARPSLHKNNYSSKEVASTWYSAKEFDSIRKDIMKTLALMRSGNLVEDEEDYGDDCTVSTSESNSRRQPLQLEVYVSTSRGLENFTPKGGLKSSVRKLRQHVVWAVMEEQDLQVDRAESLNMDYLWYDSEAIRGVYRKHTKTASQSARLLGLVDAGQPEVLSSVTTTKTRTKPRRHSLHSAPKSIRNFFNKSSSEDDLIQKAAAAFSSPGASAKKSNCKRQRRSSWFTSRSKSAHTLRDPLGAAALVA